MIRRRSSRYEYEEIFYYLKFFLDPTKISTKQQNFVRSKSIFIIKYFIFRLFLGIIYAHIKFKYKLKFLIDFSFANWQFRILFYSRIEMIISLYCQDLSIVSFYVNNILKESHQFKVDFCTQIKTYSQGSRFFFCWWTPSLANFWLHPGSYTVKVLQMKANTQLLVETFSALFVY